MNTGIVYCTSDKYWDVDSASYVSKVDSNKMIVKLFYNNELADEAYLIKTLEFYGYPLGELTEKSEKGILEALKALDNKYLTPRILAGISTGDEFALQQWQNHETEAEPLRQKLQTLTGGASTLTIGKYY